MSNTPLPAEEGGRPTREEVDALRAVIEAAQNECKRSEGQRWGYFVPGGWAGDRLASLLDRLQRNPATVDGKLAEPDAIATFLSVVEFAVERRSSGVSLTIEQARELAADIQSRQWRVPPASVVSSEEGGIDMLESLKEKLSSVCACGAKVRFDVVERFNVDADGMKHVCPASVVGDASDGEREMSETNRVDHRQANANMYGCVPCPKCGSEFRWPTADSKNKPVTIVCDSCGFAESIPSQESEKV